jgi:hypothetical protein
MGAAEPYGVPSDRARLGRRIPAHRPAPSGFARIRVPSPRSPIDDGRSSGVARAVRERLCPIEEDDRRSVIGPADLRG